MAFDTSITEQDMDPASQNFVRGLRGEVRDIEPDLAVDGLSDSLLSRLLRLLGID